jgi:hypothetical protein
MSFNFSCTEIKFCLLTTPLARNSFPNVFALSYIRALSKVEAVLIPDGKTEIPFVSRTPAGESWRHSPVKLSRGIGGMLPRQCPPCQAMPVVILTFSSIVKFVTMAIALLTAVSH